MKDEMKFSEQELENMADALLEQDAAEENLVTAKQTRPRKAR